VSAKAQLARLSAAVDAEQGRRAESNRAEIKAALERLSPNEASIISRESLLMRSPFPLSLTLLLLVSVAPTSAEMLVGSGREIAKTFCGRCHAIGAHGESPNPKSPPFRLLGKKYPLSNLEEALSEGIVVGHEGEEMPPFAFSAQQIEALLAYLASVQRK
jgi:cytochrome c553